MKLEGLFADWEVQIISEADNLATQCRIRVDEWVARGAALADSKQHSQNVAKEIKRAEGELGTLKKSKGTTCRIV